MTEHQDERRFSRRQAIAGGSAVALGIGIGAYALLSGDEETTTTSTPPDTEPTETAASASGEGSCVLAPEQTEGPYYIDDALVRRDVREDRDGAELGLELKVQAAEECDPIENATVEIWHADAEGVYSGFGGGADETFLRGAQRTDTDGIARFTTVYPGWYHGRTVHIHVKVHVGGEEVHTGQLYFDDEVTDEVYEDELYAARGERDVRNEDDGIYSAGGEPSMVTVEREGDRYAGALTMGVQT
jgi:protocatechuate 3,4-dioxygenase beta subunit